MKKHIIATAIAAALASQAAVASVTINFGMANAYGSTNTSTPFAATGLVNLLSLDSGTWAGLGDLNALFTSLTNSFTPAGVTLAGQFVAGSSGSLDGAFVFNYSGNFNAGDQLMIVAYPTLTLASVNPGLNTPGFFFRTDLVVDGSDIAYVAPSDGFSGSLFSYTIDQSGTFANDQFTSGAGAAGGSGFTTVPEPSTYALLAMSGLALGGYIVRRRNRA